MATFAELIRARAGDEHPGLLFEDERYAWSRLVREAERRAAMALGLREPGRPFHIGVLLENVPEYVLWIFAAALAGAAVVGINPTRRGEELAGDVRHTDCLFVVTDSAGHGLLDGLKTGVPPDRVLRVDTPRYHALLARRAAAAPGTGPYGGTADASRTGAGAEDLAPEPGDPLLLLFTSGSTGAPKAVICGQGRLAAIAERGGRFGIGRDSVTYLAMPLFHGNAIMANLAMATHAGATVAMRRRFSASGFLPDVRRYGVTYFNYVGRALAYILATPERPGDADNPLQTAFGTEASARDLTEFARRFGARVIEGYGSSEGAITISKVPGTPSDALGVPPEGMDVAVHDPETGRECPRARFGDGGRLLNADEAIGEIVRRDATGFEGYYDNPEADDLRLRDGWYWSGDLGYRDADGYFYFAGRDADRLRVDGENFAAAPVERILSRFPGTVMCAVYAVPDSRTGDQVMAALELDGGFDPGAFTAFLRAQADLGTKWAPMFVRLVEEMPLTATNKADRRGLRRDRWECADPVWWSPARDLRYVPLTGEARLALGEEFAEFGRGYLL
ncbi:AMP-binding protein [Planomonospora sp. ID67723]|uniref:AMP-binding protein n=1 Tax=Planomonospora sp. ID67723 TaxID=2738134 RepID=UPI0018C37084|nr:AMP-binding protein [Planomonospora sp. ID67723]MBG0828640.1 AMP-binding protein [Planomonospora sp. ID67723]